jgi:IS30 family transposase
MTKRCYTHLSDAERETLSLGLAHGQSLRTMASVLGRAPSTVSREFVRNAARGQPYRACTAHTLAAARVRQARRPRKFVALAVAVCQDPPGSRLLTRTDCWASPTRVS